MKKEYDILKVVAILMVLVSHSTYYIISTKYGGIDYQQYLEQNMSLVLYKIFDKVREILYYFHMPMFMALSGAFYYLQVKRDKWINFMLILKQKIKRLVIPFVIFTLLYVGIWKLINSSTFNGNLLGIAGILAIQLFAILSIAGFVSIFITEKTLGLVSSIISIGFVLFSGALPLDKMSPMFHWFGDNPFRRVLIEPIICMMQQESVGDFIIIYAVIVIVAIIIAELQIRCLQRREEY